MGCISILIAERHVQNWGRHIEISGTVAKNDDNLKSETGAILALPNTRIRQTLTKNRHVEYVTVNPCPDLPIPLLPLLSNFKAALHLPAKQRLPPEQSKPRSVNTALHDTQEGAEKR